MHVSIFILNRGAAELSRSEIGERESEVVCEVSGWEPSGNL